MLIGWMCGKSVGLWGLRQTFWGAAIGVEAADRVLAARAVGRGRQGVGAAGIRRAAARVVASC